MSSSLPTVVVSDLPDELGAMNVLQAARKLIKPRSSSVVYTWFQVRACCLMP